MAMEDKRLEEEKENNIVTLQLIRGGKDTTFDSGDGEWLTGLEDGTIFAARIKSQPREPVLQIFHKLNNTEKAVRVIRPGDPIVRYVIPQTFCNEFILWEILEVVKEEDLINDGSGTDKPEGLE